MMPFWRILAVMLNDLINTYRFYVSGVPTAQEGCVRIPDTCGAGSCDPKSACYKGYCMPECLSHAQCARGEQCLKGMCLKICRSDILAQTKDRETLCATALVTVMALENWR